MKAFIVILAIYVLGSNARSYYNNDEMEASQYRRAFDFLLANMMEKRTAGDTELVNFLKEHQKDQALEKVGKDLIKMGTYIDDFIDKDDQSALGHLTVAMAEYSSDVQHDSTLTTFLQHFVDGLHPSKARRMMEDY